MEIDTTRAACALEVYSFSGLTSTKIPMSAQMQWPVTPKDDSFYNLHLTYIHGLRMMGYAEQSEINELYAATGLDSSYFELPQRKELQEIEPDKGKSFAEWAILLTLSGKPHVIFCPQLHDLLVFHREYAETIRLVRY